MTHSPVILQTLKALFSRHFMGDSNDDGAWRLVPRSVADSPAIQWFEEHARDNLRGQFWSGDRNGLVCADEIEARTILVTLEEEFLAWSERHEVSDD